jgi:hypothetical protein|nr:MAG TPA: Protein of unknown function (DUF1642) [Caudoviricetes sp.]
MNKQELVKKYEETIYAIIATEEVLKDLKQLDEPQKPVVPPFVADYIKYAIENDWDLQDLFKYIEDEEDEKLLRWVYHERNQETLAAAWINGYTVEKEKRYLVKIKGIDSKSCYLKRVGNKWIISTSDECRYMYIHTAHTQKELEKAGFGEVFNSPLFEVEEVD